MREILLSLLITIIVCAIMDPTWAGHWYAELTTAAGACK